MVETLLNLIYATRAGNWNLYVETIKSTLPWFFAYDRTNYSRYLTVHHQDLLTLKDDFPEIHSEFEKGNFSVQISDKNPFGRSEADKVIETNSAPTTEQYKDGHTQLPTELAQGKTYNSFCHSELLPSILICILQELRKISEMFVPSKKS